MNNLDISLFYFINRLAYRLSFLNPIMIFLAEYVFYLVLFFYIYQWIYSKDMKLKKFLLVSFFVFLFSEITGKFLGIFINHPQPFATLPNVLQLIPKKIDNSFPSDHTIFIFSTLIFLYFYYKKYWLIVLSILVAISRIWVGVHYPKDIIVSVFITFIYIYLFKKYLINSIFIKNIIFLNEKILNNIKKLFKFKN